MNTSVQKKGGGNQAKENICIYIYKKTPLQIILNLKSKSIQEVFFSFLKNFFFWLGPLFLNSLIITVIQTKYIRSSLYHSIFIHLHFLKTLSSGLGPTFFRHSPFSSPPPPPPPHSLFLLSTPALFSNITHHPTKNNKTAFSALGPEAPNLSTSLSPFPPSSLLYICMIYGSTRTHSHSLSCIAFGYILWLFLHGGASVGSGWGLHLCVRSAWV